MYQQRQHIVAAPERFKIILKAFRVNLYLFPGNQPGDNLLQSFKIHVDVRHQRFRRRGLLPVGTALLILHGAHHGIRIINGSMPGKIIAVIPLPDFFKIHPMSSAQ